MRSGCAVARTNKSSRLYTGAFESEHCSEEILRREIRSYISLFLREGVKRGQKANDR